MKRLVLVCIASVVIGGTAAAQPTIALSATTVNPGQTVNVTVTGGPGQNYAIIGSSVNGGFSYAGVALAVGPDVVVVAMGVLDGAGNAVVAVRPPFAGTTLDRFYLQAVTSTSPGFVPLQASPGAVVRNGDLISLPIVLMRQVQGSVAAGATMLLESNCNAGEHVTGGGGNNIGAPGVNLIQSAPRPASSGVPATGWQATYHNTTGTTRTIFAYAMCMVP
jgi:hypothetical protein